MILKNGSFENMALQIRQSGHSIIVFGAGMIGTVTVPALIKEYQLEARVKFYVDNDPGKWGKTVSTCAGEYPVFSADALKHADGKKYVILLTTSRFSDSLSQLESYGNLKIGRAHV